MTSDFNVWINRFISDINLSLDIPVYIDGDDRVYTIRDYISGIRDKHGIHMSCMERLSSEYAKNGRTGVLSVLTSTAPLVISWIVPDVLSTVLPAALPERR